MDKIQMKVPLVEMDGDEMTRVIWKSIKEELICPFVELKTEYYDLSLQNRERTKDAVTVEAAMTNKKYGVGVKCATITPNKQRVEEYGLSEMWKSPNGTIRAILNGTVFRAPITTDFTVPYVRTWKKPITIARHAYGDVYKALEYRVPSNGTARLVFTDENGNETFNSEIHNYTDGGGVLQGQYNLDSSIESFAVSCFEYALSVGQDLWFSAKDTISKQYDQTFKLTFERIYNENYKERFEKAGISYFYTLIDDAVARVIRSEGGFIWALKNYDGDVMSDMVSTAFGSLAMMTSVLVSPDGNYEYEAAHGTVTRHYYRYLKGEKTSTNPMALIYAWSGALRCRGDKDGLDSLCRFADCLEKACMMTLEDGIMTGDLVPLVKEGFSARAVTTDEFISEIQKRLKDLLS